MDHGSRFFYALEKLRGAKKHVTCLLAEDGAPLTDPVEMFGRSQWVLLDNLLQHLSRLHGCRHHWISDGANTPIVVLQQDLHIINLTDSHLLQLVGTLCDFSHLLLVVGGGEYGSFKRKIESFTFKSVQFP
ncbi:unnamed protein product [Caretta caretta]